MTTSSRWPGADARECRCRECRSLLAVQHGAEIHVKYKDLRVIGTGRMSVDCRRCQARNVIGAPMVP
jgi:phage FluMu protein Com